MRQPGIMLIPQTFVTTVSAADCLHCVQTMCVTYLCRHTLVATEPAGAIR